MHPLIGSPAIDAGGTTDPGGADQRGFPRFVDGDASGTAQLDIGAVEVWPRARSLFFTDHPVTTAADEDDGSILSGFGTGTSLREVVKYAPNSVPGGFVITFSPALAGQAITLGGTEIPLNNNLFIDASNLSSPVTISGNNASRVFNIAAGASVAMHHLVITNGRSADGVIGPGGTHGADGGGILNAGSLGLFFCTISNNRSGDGGIITGFSLGTPGGSGGAIDSSGPVSLTACTLSGNSTGSGLLVSSTAASGGSGGAIFSSAPLSLTACTLSRNATGRGGQGGNEGGDGGNGGAIFAGHSLSLTACTLSGNTTGNGGQGDNGGGRGGGGGGIFSVGQLILNTCTLAGNVTGSGGFNSQSNLGGGIGGNGGSGGGIRKNDSIPYRLTASTLAANRTGPGGGGTAGTGNFGVGGGVSGGNAILKHCLIAQNIGASGAADDANVSSLAYLQANLVRTSASSSSTGPAPLTGDPLLAPLGDYGGPTFTMALKPASPASNAATGSTATSDQRGFPIVGTPDLGAYEAGTITNYANFIWETLPASATDAQHAATFDFDGDGASNGDEWLAFTHPGNPTSHFGITSFSKTGSIFSITFPTVLGRNYFVEYSLDLLTWSPFTSVFAGTGNPIAVLGNFPGATKVFLRPLVSP